MFEHPLTSPLLKVSGKAICATTLGNLGFVEYFMFLSKRGSFGASFPERSMSRPADSHFSFCFSKTNRRPHNVTSHWVSWGQQDHSYCHLNSRQTPKNSKELQGHAITALHLTPATQGLVKAPWPAQKHSQQPQQQVCYCIVLLLISSMEVMFRASSQGQNTLSINISLHRSYKATCGHTVWTAPQFLTAGMWQGM